MFTKKETPKKQQTDNGEHDKQFQKMSTSFFKSFTSSKRGNKDKDGNYNKQPKNFNFFYVLRTKAEDNSKRNGFSLMKSDKPIMDMESYADLSVLRPELIYFFSVISVRDLHDFYIDFYATFDSNKNFTLERKELAKMLFYMLDLLGQKKFKVFSDLTLIDADSFDGKLTQRIIDDIAENFLLPDDQNKVDYLQLFPFLFSFYLEYTYQEIKQKQKRLDIMRGTEIIRGKEVEILNITSLISILKEMGIDYLKEKYGYNITYRDVENILLKFKNLQKWMTFEVIQQILGSLAKIMQVDAKTQEEAKKMKLYKIIDFLTLKLCIHQNCLKIKQSSKNVNQSVYLEILILWNSAQYCCFAQQKQLTDSFEKYVNTRYLETQLFGRLEVQKCLEGYFKKHYQLMPKQQIYDIIQCHQLFKENNIVKNYKIEKDDLKISLFTMVCRDGYLKLRKYVKIKFDGITKSTNATNDYQNYGKNLENESNAQSSQRKLLEQQKSIIEVKKKKEKVKKSDSSSKDSSSEGEQAKIGAIQKFKKVVRAVQSGNAIFQEKKGDKDILKACLIMDSFLKRQTKRFENRVKETKSLNNSLIKQDNKSLQQSQLQEEEEIIFDPAQQLNQRRKEQRHKDFYAVKKEKEQKGWEKGKDEPEKKKELKEEQQQVIIQPQLTQKKLQQQQLVPEVVQSKKTDREKVANELQTVLGKSNTDFGPDNFRKALRLQSSSETAQNRPFLKQNEPLDNNVVIIDEGALEHMIKQNTKQQRARKSARDDCQCTIY